MGIEFGIAACVAALLLGSTAPLESGGPVPRHVVFFLSDDQQWNAIHAIEGQDIHTPALDRLVREGSVLTHAFCMGSWSGAVCLPSRAMILSGKSLWHVDGALQSQLTWPGWMRQQGYQTFGVGKWHNGKGSFAAAFETGGPVFFGGMSDHDRVPLHPFDPSGEYPDAARFIGSGFSSEIFADAFVRFLQERDPERRFFAYVAFTAPHDPRMAPPPYPDRYPPEEMPVPPNFLPEHAFDNGELRIRDEMLAPFPRTEKVVQEHIAAYRAMISHLDGEVGRCLQALEDSGLLDQTLILFSSDHGLAVGQHGLMGKQNLYDHSVRAPLIFRGPGVPAGHRSGALCYLFDIFPTACELVGLPVPDGVEGISLAATVQGRSSQGRPWILGAYKGVQRMVRSDRYKLIRYDLGGHLEEQLFDLQLDPYEITNRIQDPALEACRQELRFELRRLQSEFDDPEGPGQ